MVDIEPRRSFNGAEWPGPRRLPSISELFGVRASQVSPIEYRTQLDFGLPSTAAISAQHYNQPSSRSCPQFICLTSAVPEGQESVSALTSPSQTCYGKNMIFQDLLTRIRSSSHTIVSFTESCTRIARGHQGLMLMEEDVVEMLANVGYIEHSLKQVKDLIRGTARGEGCRRGVENLTASYEDLDKIPSYENRKRNRYPVQRGVKRKREPVGQPQRCLRCNTVDSPEWRRGPAGARTLCNACGLRYANVQKDKQIKARPTRSSKAK